VTKPNAPTHIGTCACCLRDGLALRIGVDDIYPRPIRHGFEAINVTHGQSGGWHTGPCEGSRFLHYGQSPEGTKHSLRRIIGMLELERKHRWNLETKPELAWSWESKRYARIERTLTPAVVEVERLNVTDERGWGSCTVEVPTYEDHHRWLMTKSAERIAGLESERNRFEKAVDEWKLVRPEPWTGKPEIVHRERERSVRDRDNQAVKYMVPKCNWRVRQDQARGMKMTSDPTKVTCKRCR